MTRPLGVLAMDWETVSPWMNLMSDIRDHYALAQYVSHQIYHKPVLYVYFALSLSAPHENTL